jgi:riboflavin kinase/FMN adenylyltransferase
MTFNKLNQNQKSDFTRKYALANEYLGTTFLSGTVFKGKQLGRTIGFPTANIKIEEDYKLIPHNGVYVVKSIINQKPFLNDEHRVQPTVSGEKLSIEVHFFDFDTDLYDQK